MFISKAITKKLEEQFKPDHLEVVDESSQHSGNRKETHFKVILVSSFFLKMTSLKRHQALYKALAEEMTKIHALSLRLYTPEEWEKEKSPLNSPQCAGKN